MTVDFESVKIVDYEWIWVELSLYIAARGLRFSWQQKEQLQVSIMLCPAIIAGLVEMNSLVGKSGRAEMPNLELRAKLEKYLCLSNLTLGIPTIHPNLTSKVHLLLLRWELHKFVVSKVDQLREKQLQKLIMNAWRLSKLIVNLKKLSKNCLYCIHTVSLSILNMR